jgi:hypothetical protein
MSKLIATVTVDVPFRSSGGVIHQHAVHFDVFQADGYYSLKPQLDVAGRQVANLPEELRFVLEKGKPVSLRGKMDGNFHVIADAVQALRVEHNLVLESA